MGFTVSSIPPHKMILHLAYCTYLLKFEHISPQVLIDLNADPNRANKFGMTPLHHASVGGDAAIVQQLIDAGARPNAADEQG